MMFTKKLMDVGVSEDMNNLEKVCLDSGIPQLSDRQIAMMDLHFSSPEICYVVRHHSLLFTHTDVLEIRELTGTWFFVLGFVPIPICDQ